MEDQSDEEIEQKKETSIIHLDIKLLMMTFNFKIYVPIWMQKSMMLIVVQVKAFFLEKWGLFNAFLKRKQYSPKVILQDGFAVLKGYWVLLKNFILG